MKKLLEELNKEIGEITRDINTTEKIFREELKNEQIRFKEKYAQKEYGLGMGLFEGKSELLIPHYVNDTGNLASRSTNLDSIGVQLMEGNYPASQIRGNRNYEISCTVQNRGDLAVPLANVEFFVSPKFKPYDFEMEVISTSYFLNTTIKGRILKGSINLLDHIRILGEDEIIHSRIEGIIVQGIDGRSTSDFQASEGQTVTFYTRIPKVISQTLIKPGSRIVEGDITPPITSRAFRMRVNDVFTISGRGTVVTGRVEQGTLRTNEKINVFKGNGGKGNIYNIELKTITKSARTISTVSAPNEVGLLLGNFRGEISRGDIIVKSAREDIEAIVKPLPEPDNIKEYEFLGRKIISVPALESNQVRFPFRTIGIKDRNEFIFVCRVFSTTPIDMPSNFDDLAPKREKKVGARKLQWS